MPSFFLMVHFLLYCYTPIRYDPTQPHPRAANVTTPPTRFPALPAAFSSHAGDSGAQDGGVGGNER